MPNLHKFMPNLLNYCKLGTNELVNNIKIRNLQ